MKKTILRISAFVCMAFMLTTSAYAWSTKNDDLFKDEESKVISSRSTSDLFYDDFSNTVAGSAPQGYAVSANGCIVTVETQDVGNSVQKNTLLLHDNRDGGTTEFIGPKVVRNFEKQTSHFALEYRFKLEKTTTDIAPLNVQVCQDNAVMCTVMISSGDGILRVGDEAPFGNTPFPADEWFTVRLVADVKQRKVDIRFQSDYLKGDVANLNPKAEHNKKNGTLTMSNIFILEDFNGDGINNVAFSMSRWAGKQHFDYIKVEKDAKRMVANVKEFVIEAPIVKSPEAVPSGRYLNILFEGDYHFWSNKPYAVGGVTMVPAENYAKLLGIKYTIDNGKITLEQNGKVLTMKVVTNTAYANGDCAVEKLGEVYVPIRYVSENFGYKIGWTKETATITVDREVE